MHKLPFVLVSLLGVAASAVAQNCTTPPAQRTFSNRDEFIGSYYYNLGNHFFDLNAQRNITISSFKTWTYDSGIGNPPTPNQVGATGTVDVYTCPTTRVGNEALNPANPGSPWTLLGSGTITVVASPGESPIVFSPPLALAAGQYGVTLHFNPTTSGPAPGPLHCLGLSPNPGLPVSDQFLTWSNDAIQQTAWTGTGQDSPNLRMTYTPDANSAHYVTVGDGCYFRPYAWFENFLPAPGMPDIANTAQTWIYTGTNYIVVPSAVTLVAPTSVSLTTGPYGVSSSTSWDDALSAPIAIPFTFPAPGGVAESSITIASNGNLYFGSVTTATYTPFTGASYGGTSTFRDGPPRLAAYFCDYDPTSGGGIYYEQDPSNQFVRVTWLNIPEWDTVIVPTAINTVQVTLYANGNVDWVSGQLHNNSVANGDNAIMGYTPGFGSRLPAGIDISTSLPYTSGDGAIPPVLGMDARPVIGTTPNVVTTNITAGTVVQILAAGQVLQPIPIDLSVIGMPGCLLTTNPFVFLTNVILPNSTFAQPLSIPNNPIFQNAQLVFQAAPLTAGYNPASLLLSNGICTRFGQ
jgi:hypothetical protein